ncbi:unnamed protein product [Urochloa humidicola]
MLLTSSTNYIQTSVKNQLVLQQKRGGYSKVLQLQISISLNQWHLFSWQPLGVYGCSRNSNGRANVAPFFNCKFSVLYLSAGQSGICREENPNPSAAIPGLQEEQRGKCNDMN